jgi:hypothetical protein
MLRLYCFFLFLPFFACSLCSPFVKALLFKISTRYINESVATAAPQCPCAWSAALATMLSALLLPFPVALCETAHAGRGLQATRDIPANALVLVSDAAAVAVNRKHLPLMCARCCTYSADHSPVPVRCPRCTVTYYCGEACLALDQAMHIPHCHLLARVHADKGLKREEASLVRLLLRMLAQDALTLASDNSSKRLTEVSKHPALHPGSPNALLPEMGKNSVDQGAGKPIVGTGGRTRVPLQLPSGTNIPDNSQHTASPVASVHVTEMLADSRRQPADEERHTADSSPPPVTSAHVEEMMADSKAIPGFLKRHKQRTVAARFLVSLLPPAEDTNTDNSPALSAPLATEISGSPFAALTSSPTLKTSTSLDPSSPLALATPLDSLASLQEQLRLCPSYRSAATLERRLACGPPNDFGTRTHSHSHTHARTHVRAHTLSHTHTHTLTHTHSLLRPRGGGGWLRLLPGGNACVCVCVCVCVCL